MSAEAHVLTPGEYIRHHLVHLQNVKQKSIIDFSVINIDSVVVNIILGALVCFALYTAARKATSGVPGRFQAAVEILFEMVETVSVPAQAAVVAMAEEMTLRKDKAVMALTV